MALLMRYFRVRTPKFENRACFWNLGPFLTGLKRGQIG